jgi:hypothetical protein
MALFGTLDAVELRKRLRDSNFVITEESIQNALNCQGGNVDCPEFVETLLNRLSECDRV